MLSDLMISICFQKRPNYITGQYITAVSLKETIFIQRKTTQKQKSSAHPNTFVSWSICCKHLHTDVEITEIRLKGH